MSLIKYTVKHTDLVEHDGHASAFQEVVYIARGADARIAELERVLRKIAEGGMFSETACIVAARKVLGYAD